MFFGRNDAKAETPVLWPPHAKSWLTEKDSDAGRDWGKEEKGTTEDEMAGWHHQLNGREFEWTLGDGDGQGGLACCNSWGRKEPDMTEWLNWTELNYSLKIIKNSSHVLICGQETHYFTHTHSHLTLNVWYPFLWYCSTIFFLVLQFDITFFPVISILIWYVSSYL